MTDYKKGVLFAVIAYLLWGFVPIYWKFIQHIPTTEILGHRIVWSLLFYQLMIWSFSRSSEAESLKSSGSIELSPRGQSPQGLGAKGKLQMVLASALLAVNWGIYIWAVNANHIVETALGYFINPLFNVLLGIFLFGEVLSKLRTYALMLAAAGVLIIGIDLGRTPWIALTLAISFALYGTFRKLSGMSGLRGGRFESLAMLPMFGAVWLLWALIDNESSQSLSLSTLSEHSVTDWLFLIGAGPVTALPLFFFSEAIRRIPFNVLGFLQYIAPTLQFLTGVYIYLEPFSVTKGLGFLLIWISLALFTRSLFSQIRVSSSAS